MLPVDDAPVAGTVNLPSIIEDVIGGVDITATQLLAGVTDVDTAAGGRSITNVSIASGGGTLTNPSAGVWHYTPAANANGTGGSSTTPSPMESRAPVIGTANLGCYAAVNDATGCRSRDAYRD